jgi:PilZ domain
VDVLITALDNSGIRVPGVLHSLSETSLQVTVSMPLLPQTPVSVEVSHEFFGDGEITTCENRDGSYFVDVKVSEMRHEPRFTVSDPVQLTLLDMPDTPSIQGEISDLSKSGLALLASSQLPIGQPVKVQLADAVVLGQVRYSNPTSEGFKTGVETESVLFQQKT